MWLPSPKLRMVGEVLLTLAVLAYVGYDLAGRGGRPASGQGEVGVVPPQGRAAVSSLSSAPSPSAPAAPARVHSLIDPSITGANIIMICGSTTTANPLIVGNATLYQAISFYGNAQCPSSPTVVSSNANLGPLSTVSIKAGSYLSLQNVITPNLPGYCGLLLMEPKSFLEAYIPTTYVANPFITQAFTLLSCGGVCPDFTGVYLRYPGCPTDAALAKTGPYVCSLAGTTVSQSCFITLNIAGALTRQAVNYMRVLINKDCSLVTQAYFKQAIAGAVGISPLAIMITYWQCSSVSAIFTVLGSDPATATAILGQIFQLAASPLASSLGLVSAALVDAPFPTAFTRLATYPKPYYPLVPYPHYVSSSNPAFFALLSLLCIPVAVFITLMVYWAYRMRYIPPPPPPPPKAIPIPVPYPCVMPSSPTSPAGGPSAHPPAETASLIGAAPR